MTTAVLERRCSMQKKLEKLEEAYAKARADESGLSNDWFYEEAFELWEDVIAYIRELKNA